MTTTRGNRCRKPRSHRPNPTSILASRARQSSSKWSRRSPRTRTARSRLTMRRALAPSTATTTRATKIRTTRAHRSSTRRHLLSHRRTRATTTMAAMTGTTTTRATRTRRRIPTSQRITTKSPSSRGRSWTTISPLTWLRSVRIASRRASGLLKSGSRPSSAWTRWSCDRIVCRSRRARSISTTTRRRLKLSTSQVALTSAGPMSRRICPRRRRHRTVTLTSESGYLK